MGDGGQVLLLQEVTAGTPSEAGGMHSWPYTPAVHHTARLGPGSLPNCKHDLAHTEHNPV